MHKHSNKYVIKHMLKNVKLKLKSFTLSTSKNKTFWRASNNKGKSLVGENITTTN